MIVTTLVTLLIGVVSAFLPVVPMEPYLVGLVMTTGAGAVLAGVAAGVGQTAGKVVIFLGTRGAIRSAWLRRWLARRTARAKIDRDGALPEASVPDRDGAPPEASVPDRDGAPPEVSVPDSAGQAGTIKHRTGLKPRRRWISSLLSLLDRPSVTAPVVLLSALTGLPPLLLTSFYAARAPISARLFGAACLLGRSARFVAVALAPGMFFS